MATSKPILCIDFDGVIHRYRHGWQDGGIYDTVTEGFFEWAFEAQELFQLVVYSSRSKDPGQVKEMRLWLADHLARWRRENAKSAYLHSELNIDFAHEKPPAFLTIDDRALRFDGDWRMFKPAELIRFKSWAASH